MRLSQETGLAAAQRPGWSPHINPICFLSLETPSSLIPAPHAPEKLSLHTQSEWRVHVERTLAVAAGSGVPGSHSALAPGSCVCTMVSGLL